MNDSPYPYVSIKKQYYNKKYVNIYKGFLTGPLIGLESNFLVWYPKKHRRKALKVYDDEVIGVAGKIPNMGLIFAVEEHRKRDRVHVRDSGAVIVKGMQVGVIGGISNGKKIVRK
jgi:hypothetical protein